MSAFQRSSVAALIAGINAANATTFSASDLSFSNPKVVTGGTWQGIASDRNTAVRATAASANYQGNKVILYNRLNLSQLANLPGVHLALASVTKVWDALPALATFLGVPFTQNDLQNLDVTTAGDGSGNIQLSADPNSLGWIGSVVLPFTKGGVSLPSVLTTTTLPGVNYPVADASAPPASAVYGPMYLYPYDFTTNQATFLTYSPGALNQTQIDYLVTAIKAVDVGSGKASWIGTGSNTTYNLTGASIISNGLNDSATLGTNPLYKYVLRLRLAGTQTNPAGDLYLHYNDPFNPNDF